MAQVKVRLTKQDGRTGLRGVGTILFVDKAKADQWVSLGLAEKVNKPRKKKSNVDKSSKQDDNGEPAD